MSLKDLRDGPAHRIFFHEKPGHQAGASRIRARDARSLSVRLRMIPLFSRLRVRRTHESYQSAEHDFRAYPLEPPHQPATGSAKSNIGRIVEAWLNVLRHASPAPSFPAGLGEWGCSNGRNAYFVTHVLPSVPARLTSKLNLKISAMFPSLVLVLYLILESLSRNRQSS